MRTWELIRQALAGAARARLRSTLTALGVAIGCGALVSMLAFALGLQQQIEKPLKKLGVLNEIFVYLRKQGPDVNHQPPLDAAAIARFRAMPGVKYAYPELSLSDVEVRHGEFSTRTYALGAPREIAVDQTVGGMLAAGRGFSLADEPELIIGSSLVKQLGFESPAAAIDQTVRVTAAGLADADEQGKYTLQSKSLALRIVGVFEPADLGEFTPRGIKRAVALPLDILAALPGEVDERVSRARRGLGALIGYQGVIVRAEDPAQVVPIAEAIEKQGYETRTVMHQLEEMRTAFLLIESLLSAVGSVALVIAGLGIANTLLMAVLERYEEIGLYKAIGATDGDVRLMFLAEAAVLGIVGSLAGLVLAAVVCWVLQLGVDHYLASHGVKRPADVFFFPWWLLSGSVAISTALSIVSGLYPASRAARVDPIQALRRS